LAWVIGLAVARGQQPATIHVLLLNGNDGKPLTTGNDGRAGSGASLTIFAECAKVCLFPGNRFSWGVDGEGRTEVPNFPGLLMLEVMKPTSWYVYCEGEEEPDGMLKKEPKYSVSEILEKGVVAENVCNPKLHVPAHPGELVFFLRPLTMWEKLKRGPQM
jgi:hypothetical protein